MAFRNLAKTPGAAGAGKVEQARGDLARSRFPGDVRKSENAGDRATPLAAGCESGAEAAETDGQTTRAFTAKTLADVERDLIFDTLGHTRGNRTHAANLLGISIRTLRNKLNQYDEEGYDVPPPQAGVAAA